MLLLVGGLVAVVAVVALHHPQGPQAASASVPTRDTSSARSVAPSSSAPRSPTHTPSTSPPSSPAPTSSAPSAAGKLPLIVLNNTSATPGSVAASRFSQAGWTVSDVSTFEGDILSTAAYYDPAIAGAQQAAQELQREFPAIQRVKPKFDGLPQGPIVVVLTSDYS